MVESSNLLKQFIFLSFPTIRSKDFYLLWRIFIVYYIHNSLIIRKIKATLTEFSLALFVNEEKILILPDFYKQTFTKPMSGNRTFSMIKPDAVAAGNAGAILKMMEEAGFKVLALKMTKMTAETAGKFYEVHKERPFYKDLCAYMSSGPFIPLILEKENAVEDFRKLIGATDPAKAEEGTIRKLFAKSIEANAVHGSDSDENAKIESAFFFSATEQVNA